MDIQSVLDRLTRLEEERTPRRIAVVHFGREDDAAARLAELKKDPDKNLTILEVHYVSQNVAS